MPGAVRAGRKRERKDSYSVLLSMSSRKWDRGEKDCLMIRNIRKEASTIFQTISGRESGRLGPEPFPDAAESVFTPSWQTAQVHQYLRFLFIAASLGKRLYRAPLMIPLWDVRKIEQAVLSRGEAWKYPGRQIFRFSRRRKKEESLRVRHAPVSRWDVTEKAFSR